MKKENKEISSLKRQNKKLKELLLEYEAQEVIDLAAGEGFHDKKAKERKRDKEIEKAKEVVRTPSCPKCRGVTDLVDLGIYRFYWCKDRKGCNYREKIT